MYNLQNMGLGKQWRWLAACDAKRAARFEANASKVGEPALCCIILSINCFIMCDTFNNQITVLSAEHESSIHLKKWTRPPALNATNMIICLTIQVVHGFSPSYVP